MPQLNVILDDPATLLMIISTLAALPVLWLIVLVSIRARRLWRGQTVTRQLSAQQPLVDRTDRMRDRRPALPTLAPAHDVVPVVRNQIVNVRWPINN